MQAFSLYFTDVTLTLHVHVLRPGVHCLEVFLAVLINVY